MKTIQLSANAKVIVDWLESQNYKLHNKPGIETHYPRGPKEKSPTVIDLCFSRGEISNSIDTWMINHDSTSDHSIIGIRIIRPEIRLSSPAKGKYIGAWSKANWTEFSSYIYSKQLDYSSISSKIESEKAIESLYQCIEEGIDKAVPLVKMKTKYAPWWSQNLEWLLTKVKRARKRMATQHSVEANKIFTNLKMTWEKAVRNAKQRYWKRKLEQATNSSIWSINKRHTMVHSNAIPDLVTNYFISS
jgi:hypothetical protein